MHNPCFIHSGAIRGRRVLITGASSGIGEELAYHYARLHARVMITARREDLLKKVRVAINHAYWCYRDAWPGFHKIKVIVESNKSIVCQQSVFIVDTTKFSYGLNRLCAFVTLESSQIAYVLMLIGPHGLKHGQQTLMLPKRTFQWDFFKWYFYSTRHVRTHKK